MVIREQEAVAQVAKAFRVTPAYVSMIVQKVRKKPESLQELVEEDAKKAIATEDLTNYIEAYIRNDVDIMRAHDM